MTKMLLPLLFLLPFAAHAECPPPSDSSSYACQAKRFRAAEERLANAERLLLDQLDGIERSRLLNDGQAFRNRRDQECAVLARESAPETWIDGSYEQALKYDCLADRTEARIDALNARLNDGNRPESQQ